jgi:hypothetical protein
MSVLSDDGSILAAESWGTNNTSIVLTDRAGEACFGLNWLGSSGSMVLRNIRSCG